MAFDLHPQGDEPDVTVDINTTPLIDVMLVLLIMLILTIPLQTHSVKLDMPAGPPPPAQVQPQVVRLDIAADGTVYWNGEMVMDQAGLEERLGGLAARSDGPELHIRSDAAAAYRHVAGVLAAAQRKGVVKLGVVGAERFLD